MATLATLIVRLITDVGEFQAGMDASIKSVKKVGTEFTQVGHDLEKMGGFLTGAITVPIIAAGAAILKFATDSSKSFDTYKEHLAAATLDTGEIKNVIKDAAAAQASAVQDGETAQASAIREGERAKADVIEASGRAQADAVSNYENDIEDIIRSSQQAQQDLYESSEKTKGDITKDQGRALRDLKRRIARELADAEQIQDPEQRAARLKQIAEDKAYDLKSIEIDKNDKLSDLAESNAFDLKKIEEKKTLDLQAAKEKEAKAFENIAQKQSDDLKAIAIKQADDLHKIALKQAADLQAIEEKKAQAIEDINKKQADAMAKVRDEYKALSPGVIRMAQDYDKLKAMLTPVQNKFQDMADTILESVIPVIEKLMPSIEKFVDDLGKIVDQYSKLDIGTRTNILGFIAFLAALGPTGLIIGKTSMAIGAFLKFWVAVGPNILKIIPAISQIIPWLSSFTSLVGEAGLGGALSAAFPGLAAFASGFVAIGLPIFTLIAAIGLLVVTIVLFGKDAVNTIVMVATIYQTMGQRMWAPISQFIANLTHTDWAAIGQNILIGIGNGIMAAVNWLFGLVTNIANDLVNIFHEVFDLHSPSLVFADIGKNMMLGLEVGVTKNSRLPISATTQTTGTMIQAADAFRSGSSGGRHVSIGPITFNGDLSESQKASLETWFHRMISDDLMEVFESAA